MTQEKASKTRKSEILTATKELIDQGYYYKDINMKKISVMTSFSRPSIYNYFQTKEEIFLALLTQEYVDWSDELYSLNEQAGQIHQQEYIEKLAQSLENRPLMLKLVSNNLTDFEENSRMELIIPFKASYGETLKAADSNLQHFFQKMSKKDRNEFLFAFFPFIFGLNPYAVGTKKQKEGLKQAGVAYTYHSVHDLTLNLLKKLLKIEG